MRISFLHTIEANQALFEQAAQDLNLPTQHFRHLTRPALREAVEAAGGVTTHLKAQVRDCLQTLATDADAVVVTCATLGALVDEWETPPVPVLRADVALARAAAARGGQITVLCAAESALDPVRKLFTSHAQDGSRVTVMHLSQAWTSFRAGDKNGYLAEIAAATRLAYANGAESVAYAHPWMAPAAKLVEGTRRPLDIPHAALRALLERVSAERR